MIDELTVNNTPLANPARIVSVWDGARGVAARRSTNLVVPMRDGEVWLPKARQAKLFTVGLWIVGVDPVTGTSPATVTEERAWFNANWRDFVRLISDDTGPLTLGRTVAYPGGRIEKQTADAEVDGAVEPEMVGPAAARVAVTFKLLDGVWLSDWADTLDKGQTGPASTLGAASGLLGVDSIGDTTTYQIQVVMSGANGPQRLTNTQTGDWVQFDGDTTTVPVVLDVPTFTAAQGDANVISQVTSGDTQVSPYWMVLRPGPNELLVEGGGLIQVRYRGAHS